LRHISLNSHTVKEKEEGWGKGMAIGHTDAVRNGKDKQKRKKEKVRKVYRGRKEVATEEGRKEGGFSPRHWVCV
jgi:hypothetical protein